MSHSNCTVLQHPSGADVVLIGTQHVSLTHGSRAAAAVEQYSPSRVLLELDEARFQQVDDRLRYLMHGDTASLMELAADPAPASLLPDALLWAQHMQRFALLRNEGVPLLLGSLYGADFLQAALAATALPQQAALVLADQPQHVTLARFKALTDTMAALRRLFGGVLGTAYAEAAHPYSPQQLQQQEAEQHPWLSSHSTLSTISSGPSAASPEGLLDAVKQLQRIFSAAAQLAAGRMVHLCLQWWSMALTSQARWYGDNVHPVFLLVGNAELQQKLEARGCEGVREAAAAAGRLLEVAAAAGSSGSSGVLPALQDVQDIRMFVASLERLMWDAGSSSSSAKANGNTSSSSSSSSQVMHWLQDSQTAAGAEGFSELLLLKPWWVTLSERFSNGLAEMTNSPTAAAAAGVAGSQGGVLASALQHHSHANVTAAAAYDQAVLAERNRVLVTAMWQHAKAAAAEAAAAAAAGQANQHQQQQGAAVVAVVGYNHVPGIVQLWRQLQHSAAATDGSSSSIASSSSSDVCGLDVIAAGEGAFLPWQVTLTDAVAGGLELAAAGGAGLAYWMGIQRWGPAAATAATAAAGSNGSSGGLARLGVRTAGSSGGLRRLGLLLLPAAVALLPLQRDAKRLQEAGGLLSRVAVVNDVILGREARGMDGGQERGVQGAGASIMRMAHQATAATTGMV